MGGEEDVVSSLSPVLGGEENDHVEAGDSDYTPYDKGKFYRLGECPFQRPFINCIKKSSRSLIQGFGVRTVVKNMDVGG